MSEVLVFIERAPLLAALIGLGLLLSPWLLWKAYMALGPTLRHRRELAQHRRVLEPLGYEVSGFRASARPCFRCVPSEAGWPEILQGPSEHPRDYGGPLVYRCALACEPAPVGFDVVWGGAEPLEGAPLEEAFEVRGRSEPWLHLAREEALGRYLASVGAALRRGDVSGRVWIGREVKAELRRDERALAGRPLFDDLGEVVEATRALAAAVAEVSSRDAFTPAELLALATGDAGATPTLAAKVLLSQHPGSFEARTYAAEHLFGFERHPEADLLTGWSLDEQVAFELEGEVLLERRVAAILSGGVQDAAPMCRDLMARCSPAELHARVGFASPKERGARPKAALASAIVWHALSPEYDAEQARAWVEVFMPHMPAVDEVAFTEEITLSADEVFARVAGVPGPDALATAWTRRVDEVWDASLEARLPDLFAHHTLGPRATVDLVDAANRHEVAAAWEPARDALFRARLAALESGDDARWEEVREALLAWRGRAEELRAQSNG